MNLYSTSTTYFPGAALLVLNDKTDRASRLRVVSQLDRGAPRRAVRGHDKFAVPRPCLRCLTSVAKDDGTAQGIVEVPRAKGSAPPRTEDRWWV